MDIFETFMLMLISYFLGSMLAKSADNKEEKSPAPTRDSKQNIHY